MSDVRKSVPAKVIASLLILVSVFSLCWQGMAVLRGIDYVLTDSWQDTWEFKELIRELKKINPGVENAIFRSVENVCLDTVIAYKQKGTVHHFLDSYEEGE